MDDDQLEPRWRPGHSSVQRSPGAPIRVRIEPTSSGAFRALLPSGARMHLTAPTRGQMITRVREWLADAEIQE